MGITKHIGDYDSINGTLYPVVPALLQEDKEQENFKAGMIPESKRKSG